MNERPVPTRRGLASLLLVALAAGCATPYQGPVYERDGERYGETSGFIWRANWWNFYERGQSYAEGGYIAEAVQDFEWAIERREADQRNARSYGMHFIDDYFPHRELGISLFAAGDLDGAQRELVTSLGQEPSARAMYYLNEVRRAILVERGDDARPTPTIELDAPVGPAATREPWIWVTGTARSEAYVEALDLNGRTPRIELARKELPFRARIPLAPGVNRIRITATDLLGSRATRDLEILSDRNGPTIALQDIVERGREIEIVAALDDASGVARFEVEGNAEELAPGSDGRLRLRVPRPGDDRIAIAAEDRVGNRTEATIRLDRAAGGASSSALPAQGVLLAAAGDLPAAGLVDAEAPEHDPTLTGRTSRLVNEIVWRLGGRPDRPDDALPPRLRIVAFDDIPGELDVFVDRVFVAGVASDPSDVARIEINGETIGAARGRHVIFSSTVALEEGANPVHVEAADATARSTRRDFTVNRRRPAIRDPNVRLALAALPFRQGETVGPLSEVAQGFLLDALTSQRRYRAVERERLADIIEELQLSTTDLIDRDAALEVGELVAADAILEGRVYDRAGTIEAWVRIVDTETSEVLALADVYGEDADLSGVQSLMAGLAQKLAVEIPIVEEAVEWVDDDVVRIARGRSARLKPSLRVALFREGEVLVHPLTGLEIGRSYERVADGRLSEVDERSTRAELSDGGAARPGDLLVVR